MKKKPLFILVLCCTILIVGCAEQKILERISLPTLIGYDLDLEKQELTTTAVIRQVSPEFESKVEVQSATAITSKGTRIDTNLKTSKKIMAGQLRVILLGETIAKNGLEGPLHTTTMTSEISTGVYLAIVEGDVKPLIEYNYKNIEDIGQHIFSLMDQNIEQQLSISSTLHEVVRDTYSPYKDVVLPMIKRQDESIVITDIVLFNGDGTMVGKLPAKDVPYLKMIRSHFDNGSLELALPTSPFNVGKEDFEDIFPIVIDSIKSKKQLDLVNPDTPEFDLKVKIDCRLLEVHRSIDISKKNELLKLQKEINKKMKSELTRVIEYCQEVGADIFGFGAYYYSHTNNPNLTEEEWRNLYKNMKVNLTVDVNLLRNGVFE